jgi:hypothetical protein
MKIISLMFSAASGKLGGIVASHNRGGAYIRHHSIPTQPRTAAQKLVRNQLQAFSAAFKSLTASQIAGWNALGATVSLKSKLGTTYHPTGQQLFVSCNKHLANVGITTQLSNAPTIPSIPGMTTFTGSPTGNGATVSDFGLATTPNLDPGYAVQIRATAAMSNGRTFVGKSAYRNVWGIQPAPSQPANAAIFSAYIARFGPLPASGQVGFLMRYVDPVSGFVGTPVSVLVAFTQSSAGVSYTLTAGTPGGTLTAAGLAATVVITPGNLVPGGFTGALSYSVTGIPSGAAGGFASDSKAANLTNTLYINKVGTVATGTYAITVTAQYGSATASVTFNITLT